MNREIIPFEYEGNPVRIIKDGPDSIFWVAKDSCHVLGISKYRDFVGKHLDDDERVSIFVDTLGGPQDMLCVNESGLYTLILKSNKPAARPFRKWVTSEVLPSIRKNGHYKVSESRFDQLLEEARKYDLTPNQRIRLLHLSVKMMDWNIEGKERIAEQYLQMCEKISKNKSVLLDSLEKCPHIHEFVKERLSLHPANRISKDELYLAYCDFADLRNFAALNRENFFKNLYSITDAQASRVKDSDGSRKWHVIGVGLKSSKAE